jgi:hypothetical protein
MISCRLTTPSAKYKPPLPANDEKSLHLQTDSMRWRPMCFCADRKDASKIPSADFRPVGRGLPRAFPAGKEAFTRLYNEYFFRRHNQFWKDEAMKNSPSYAATRLLACAERLGMIPDCVPDVLKELQMLSLENRYPKRLGDTFADAAHYPYLSVATPSTHDIRTARLWKETPALTRRFWNEVLAAWARRPPKRTAKRAKDT